MLFMTMGCIYSSVSGWDMFWEAYAAIEVSTGGSMFSLGEKALKHAVVLPYAAGVHIGQEELSEGNRWPFFHPIENETTWQGETARDSQSGGVSAHQLFKSRTGQGI